jgi:acyl carrier protein
MRELYYSLIERHTGKSCSEISDSMAFRDDLGMDSLNVAMLYPDIEDSFNITFSPLDDDLGEIFKTVGTLWGFIESRGSL